jgi:O-antigen ligase
LLLCYGGASVWIFSFLVVVVVAVAVVVVVVAVAVVVVVVAAEVVVVVFFLIFVCNPTLFLCSRKLEPFHLSAGKNCRRALWTQICLKEVLSYIHMQNSQASALVCSPLNTL